MRNDQRTLSLGESRLNRLACDLTSRQAAIERLSQHTIGGYQARAIADSMREMVKTVKVAVPFRTGSHNLEAHLKRDLIRLADTLKNLPVVTIDIEAHTDIRGSRRFNRKLSFERARAVRHIFLSRGVPLRRITARAVGTDGALYPKGDRGGYPFDRQAIVSFNTEEEKK